MFTTKLVLVIFNLDKEMRVEANVLDYATGGVLLVKYKNKKWRSVAFISKSLNVIECNYEIHDKEILVIIQCLEA